MLRRWSAGLMIAASLALGGCGYNDIQSLDDDE